ncbi:MAG: hypothetical protein LBJ72_01660 [Dysgonamonadaceae bacterium]|jgi:hypothetical protein|nr:hypothetical protein [Dysgonamonadaceae bacterium]
MEYDELVQKNQDGEIDDLEFLMSQPELATLFIEEMREKGLPYTNENAMQWLSGYENNNLYE